MAATIIGLFISFYAANEERVARNKQIERENAGRRAQSRIEEVRNIRERRRALAQARIQRARAVAATEFAGASGSSGQAGATLGITSQAARETAFLGRASELSTEATTLFSEAAGFESQASTARAIGGVGSSIFSRNQ